MLTPQEVKTHAFQRASFGGYQMNQVDIFLDDLTEDYTALYNENAVLKSKMKVLVDKVEEYRSTEEAMRKALMTAQRMADEMVREAEVQRDAMLAEAEEAAARRIAELKQQVDAEEFRLSTARSRSAKFVDQVRAMYNDELHFLSRLEDITPAAPTTQDRVEEAANEIEDSVQRLLAKAMAESEQEEPFVEEAEQPTTEFAPVQDAGEEPTTRIDLGNLKFSRDYKIK